LEPDKRRASFSTVFGITRRCVSCTTLGRLSPPSRSG